MKHGSRIGRKIVVRQKVIEETRKFGLHPEKSSKTLLSPK